MFERFTPDARTVVVDAQEHACRLGHRYIGCEHLLLAVASTGRPASAVLREQGITPAHVEAEIVRQVGLGGGAGLFGDLDRDALSAMGIDLDAVRTRVEESFGTAALARAADALHGGSRASRLNLRRAVPRGLLRRWHRRRPARKAWASCASPTGPHRAVGSVQRGHLPLTTRARKCLHNSLHEAQARNDRHIGVEHVALGLIEMDGGPVAPILLALGAPGPALRAAIIDRYRQAS